MNAKQRRGWYRALLSALRPPGRVAPHNPYAALVARDLLDILRSAFARFGGVSPAAHAEDPMTEGGLGPLPIRLPARLSRLDEEKRAALTPLLRAWVVRTIRQQRKILRYAKAYGATERYIKDVIAGADTPIPEIGAIRASLGSLRARWQEECAGAHRTAEPPSPRGPLLWRRR